MFGRFDIEKNSMAMALWQHTESNDKQQYYSSPINSEGGKEKSDNGVDPLQSSSGIKIEMEEIPPGVSSSRFQREERRYLSSLTHLCEIAIEWRICDKCGTKFPLENMLKRHKLSHKNVGERRNMKSSSNSRFARCKVTKSRRTIRTKSKYICHICDFSCDKRATMSSHLRKKHDTKTAAEEENQKCEVCVDNIAERDKMFSCENCSFECKKRSTLASHVSKKHSHGVKLEIDETAEEESYECADNDILRQPRNRKKSTIAESLKCNTCGFECTNRSTLYSHKRRHRAKEASEVYSCNECDFKTGKKTSLYSHIKRKHKPPKASNDPEQPELFSCSQCDYKNKNKYELKVHVARKHTDDFKFSCETCNKKFKVKGDLTNHVRFSHREQPVICDVCGKTCLNSNSLYVHQKFAHYKAKYECQVCKRRMVSQENLDEHMLRQHEKRENVVCEECGKTFSRNSRLKIHMRIHTGDKPYDCTICNKSFARRTALKQHLLIHTGMRPYVCDICGKAFTQKPGLISHRKSHPGPLPPLPRVLIDHILNDVLRPPL